MKQYVPVGPSLQVRPALSTVLAQAVAVPQARLPGANRVRDALEVGITPIAESGIAVLGAVHGDDDLTVIGQIMPPGSIGGGVGAGVAPGIRAAHLVPGVVGYIPILADAGNDLVPPVGPGGHRLGFQRLRVPESRHLPGDHPFYVGLEVHHLDGIYGRIQPVQHPDGGRRGELRGNDRAGAAQEESEASQQENYAQRLQASPERVHRWRALTQMSPRRWKAM